MAFEHISEYIAFIRDGTLAELKEAEEWGLTKFWAQVRQSRQKYKHFRVKLLSYYE